LAGIAGFFYVLQQAIPHVSYPYSIAKEAAPEIVGGPWRPQHCTGCSPCLVPIFHFSEPLITAVTDIIMQDLIHL
jgi:hypothetical protein